MELEKEFQDFCGTLRKEKFSDREIQEICKPLYRYQRKEILKKYCKLLLGCFVFYALIQWCDCFNWFVSALGRLVLIQILPIWNWPALYNAKCLIERPLNNENIRTGNDVSYPVVENGNCLLCENIDFIPTVSNITFTTLENLYLESGIPVVITDSHRPITADELFETIFYKTPTAFLQSSPCDTSTNLIIKKFFNIDLVLRKAWQLLDSSEKWFVQMRNCQSSAVRASRLFITKPYYYPVHLEPYYSSWFIMSQNFGHRQYQKITLQGLIIVQQLSGTNSLKLKPKKPCDENCPLINVQLKEGEGFVFSSDLWELSYKHNKSYQQASVTTIMEIDWNV
ncbi:uncharacterized protein LOC133328030 [Musca vetustissima]|uniref:uncharacterized protein LOC133328030 n=1 Tax=Musca vetustissima TaxID=27455 RepID=UPI002AB72B98|nr:uncharacterized protein LOC133328030 [Musca vetustissima]